MPLHFESYAELNVYIRTHGPLPTDREVWVGQRVVFPHRCTPAGECRGARV